MKCAKAAIILIIFVSHIAPIIYGIPVSPPSWMKRWSPWERECVTEEPSNNGDVQEDDNDSNHVPSQLEMEVCPAQKGRHLRDYWRCLWRTSVTAMGMEQERRNLIESYYEAARRRPFPKKEKSEMAQKGSGLNPGSISSTEEAEKYEDKERIQIGQKDVDEEDEVEIVSLDDEKDDLSNGESGQDANDMSQSKGNPAPKKRVKRDVDQAIEGGFMKVAKLLALDKDLGEVLQNPSLNEKYDRAVRICQQTHVKPGISLLSFLSCLRESSESKESFREEIQDEVYPEVYIPYDKRDFTLQKLNLNPDKADEKKDIFVLDFGYDRMKGDVDNLPDMHGADPYLTEQASDFRYRFNNLLTSQQMPAWSYIGQDAPHSWHNQALEKFTIPLKSGADIERLELISDLAQFYPGLGELASELPKLDNPIDADWQKDNGHYTSYRYLIPFLDDKDLAYFKYKDMIEESVTRKPDVEVIQDIIDALEKYENESSQPVSTYQNVADVPYINTYRDFLNHYYGVNVATFIKEYAEYSRLVLQSPNEITEKDLKNTYEVIRQASLSYVDTVLSQQECLKAMMEKYTTYREDDDVFELIQHAEEDCPTSARNVSESTAKGERYQVPDDTLEELYQDFWDRKYARQSYSLSVYPVEFPVCKNSDPSPINIDTGKGSKSSIRDYEFGEVGFRLQRFFMMAPQDGTPLLSVGILSGERLDESSVTLNGGAIKGENLTFQYMFLRFAKTWKGIGSEHHLNGNGAPMEIQMLFTVTGSADDKKYYHILSRIQNVLFQFRGKLVVILSVLVNVVKDDEELMKVANETNQDPYLFEPLAQAAYHFRKEWQVYPEDDVPRGYVSKEPTLRLSDFIPHEDSKFFNYRGSLSWPPCFGYVLWSVYEKPLHMSKRQFDQFAMLPAFGISDSGFFGDNVREMKHIHVDEEENPDLNFAQKQALINKRTVERYILIGEHKANDHEHGAGTVDLEGYFDSIELNKAHRITADEGRLAAVLICSLHFALI